MILDSLANAGLYSSISPRLAAGFRFLRDAHLDSLPQGKTPLADGLFALVQDYHTKPLDEGFFESHRRHIDIQYLVTGTERIAVAPINTLPITHPFDESKDLIKYGTTNGDWITLRPGHFAVFFPHDAHMPGIRIDAPVLVRKVVVKVPV